MASTTSEKKFDIVVFGATGFTGQFVVEEIARTEDEEGSLKWAIAGRSMSKLQNVLKQASKSTGKDLEETPILVADVKSESSLKEMCQQARVVLNCVGPYQFYGTPVVRACIENKAHHIDISGEPVFLENTQLVYHDKAKEAGVYILEACGFDSIPSDMGATFTRDQFKGDLNHIEAYLAINFGPEGRRFNSGTWKSAIQGFASGQKLKEIRKQLFIQPLPRSKTHLPRRKALFYSGDVNNWCLPFVGADRSIVMRSQRHNYEQRNERVVEFMEYSRMPHLLAVVFMMFFGIIFAIFSNFSLGRKLMEKFPRLFSLGLFSDDGPTPKQMEGTSFTMTMIGHGYETKIADPKEQHEDKPTKKIVTRVSGPELAYVTTPICMVQAAYTLLKEQDKLPPKGGVYTPGAAFAKTSLVQRLNDHNIKVEVLEQ